MYYTLEVPADLDQLAAGPGEVAEMLEALVSAWDTEVERARAAEASVATTETRAELEALKESHRALVETLERSIADLSVLQEKTAGLVRFVSEAVGTAAGPDWELCLTSSGPTEFPSNDETEVIDRTNRRDLATLDVPSRWRPIKRRRARRAARSRPA